MSGQKMHQKRHRYFFGLIFFACSSFAMELNVEVENTNIAIYHKGSSLHDINRLRLYLDIEHDKFISKIILDNNNIYNFKKNDNENKTKLYRAYLKYSNEKHLFVLGRQRVPFGVGRIWNPIDVFNPIDSTAIEIDEREGVNSFRYEYALNNLSNIDATLSKRKFALRVKSFLEVADVALVVVKDDENDKEIIGYEFEGELGDTKIELRSEGGRFKTLHDIYYEYIAGAEYGFENSFVMLGEYKYNSADKSNHVGFNFSYQPSMLTSLNLLGIKNLEDKSYMISPGFMYSLSDESTLSAGVFLHDNTLENRYFLKYFIYF